MWQVLCRGTTRRTPPRELLLAIADCTYPQKKQRFDSHCLVEETATSQTQKACLMIRRPLAAPSALYSHYSNHVLLDASRNIHRDANGPVNPTNSIRQLAQLSAQPACHLSASLRRFAPLAAQAKLSYSHPPLRQQICRLATVRGAGRSCVVRLVRLEATKTLFATGLAAEQIDTFPAKEAEMRKMAIT